jgi:peptidoglycan/xylan/chitin deacetylase (PgdA/CDA1 family)
MTRGRRSALLRSCALVVGLTFWSVACSTSADHKSSPVVPHVTPSSSTAAPAGSTTTTTTAARFVTLPAFAVPTRGADGSPIVVDRGRRDRRSIALTFDSNMDDGMLRRLDQHMVDSYDNEAVVDALDRLEVPATFFLAGKWVERYPASVRRIGSNPRFEVGSHSYAHLAFAEPCYHRALAPADMAPDVERSFAVLRAAGVIPVPLFRFPGLCVDSVALHAISSTGVVVIGGTASGDAFNSDRAAIVRQALSSAQPGVILVFHITKANAPVTADVVEPVVAGLRARGYTLVKVSSLLTGV